MSNKTSNLALAVTGQQGATATLNELHNAASPATLFAYRAGGTAGLTWGYYGGMMLVDGVLSSIANGSVTLTNTATNYVEATRGGVVSVNTSGFTAGRIPLYAVVTASDSITDWTDYRVVNAAPTGKLTKAVTSGSVTLTAAEGRNDIIELTGTLTVNSEVILPAVVGRWTLYNNTSGAYALTIKTAAGSGVVVSQGARIAVYGDGFNICPSYSDPAALGLASMAYQGANAVAITGGAIDGADIGVTVPGAGNFTTLNTTGLLKVGNGAGAQTAAIDGAAGQLRDLRWSSGGALRWVLRVNNVAEGGSNSGSDLVLIPRDDSGNALTTAWSVKRSTGNLGFGTPDPDANAKVLVQVSSFGDARRQAVIVKNTDTSAASAVWLSLLSGGSTTVLNLVKYGSEYTGVAGLADYGMVNSDGAGVFIAASGAGGDIRFMVGGATPASNTKMALWNGGRLTIGDAPADDGSNRVQIGGNAAVTGQVLVNAAASIVGGLTAATPKLYVSGDSGTTTLAALVAGSFASGAANGAVIDLFHSRSGLKGDLSVANTSGDALGFYCFSGIPATTGALKFSSFIKGLVDAAPGATYVPGRLELHVVSATGVDTTAVTVKATGNVLFGTSSDDGINLAQFNGSIKATRLNLGTGAILDQVTKRKTADESVTSSVTLQNDDHLSFAIASNEEWCVEFLLDVGAALSTTGLKLSVNCPTGATVNINASVTAAAVSTSGTYVKKTTTLNNPLDFTSANLTAAGEGMVLVTAWVLNAGNAGTVQLQHAQSTSSATAVTVRRGSVMKALRVA